MRVANIILIAAVASVTLAAVMFSPSRDMLRNGRGNLSRHGIRQQEQSAERVDQRSRQSARRWQYRNAQGRRKHWWFLSAVPEETQAMSAAAQDQTEECQPR